MLSKVLKGAKAGLMQPMVFTSASAPVQSFRQPDAFDSSGAAPAQAILLDRIRTLEANTAASNREAFAAGQQQGEQQAGAVLAPVLERMNASLCDITNMRPELRRLAEKDAIDLALQVARRILHREINIDSGALNALARVIFDRLTQSETWHLTVNPRFAQAVRDALPAASASRLRIEADPDCLAGTFIVRSAEGVIDASVDTQLAEIGRGLTDKLTRR